MASDATTFFLGFAAVFGVLGWYLWHLERKVDDMRRRLESVQRSDGPGGRSASGGSDGHAAGLPTGPARPRAPDAPPPGEVPETAHVPPPPADDGEATTQKSGKREDRP